MFSSISKPISEEVVTKRIANSFAKKVVRVREDDQWYESEEIANRVRKCSLILQKAGVTPGSVVALQASPGVSAIVGILSIWLCRAAYLPLDPEDKSQRQPNIISQSGAKVVLYDKPESRYSRYHNGIMIPIDASESNDEFPVFESMPEDPAYVIYTSGTTGDPKGVIVTHGSLAGYAAFASNRYLEHLDGPVVFHGSLAFDMSVTSIIAPLMNGNPIITTTSRNLPDLLAEETGIAMVKVTPTHIRMLRHWPGIEIAANASHTWVIGGEALHSHEISDWISSNPDGSFFNEYGPTEAVVGCVVYQILEPKFQGAVPIGTPIPGAEILILGPDNLPVSPGSTGELYIGGSMLAKEYLGRPDLTAEKFVYFEQFGDRRFYKTGDIGYTKNENIYFMGRRDDQVKINGHRVELGEVSAAAESVLGVTEAVCVARKIDDKDQPVLGLYFVGEVEPSAILNELRNVLPSYLCPLTATQLAEIPLRSSGKLDIEALPEPESNDMRLATLSGMTSTERKLARIWAEVLRISVDSIKPDDHFFTIGGHSLLATEVVASVYQQLGKRVPVASIFSTPIMRNLASLIDMQDHLDEETDDLIKIYKSRRADLND